MAVIIDWAMTMADYDAVYALLAFARPWLDIGRSIRASASSCAWTGGSPVASCAVTWRREHAGAANRFGFVASCIQELAPAGIEDSQVEGLRLSLFRRSARGD